LQQQRKVERTNSYTVAHVACYWI